MTTAEEWELHLDCYKLIPKSQLVSTTEELGLEGTIVATSGCFDILHAGHVRFLCEAARLGVPLVVCVNDDASVRRLKGPGRPIVSLSDRMEVLNALEPVGYLVAQEEDTPESLLEVIRPNLWVKGGDYRHKDLPERAVIEKYGGVVQILPYDPGHSTTALWARLSGSLENTDGR